MLEIIWLVVVKEESRGQFELAFGPGGAWSKLFSRRPGYRGTTVMRDVNDPRRYLVADIWDTLEQRQQTLEEHHAEYDGLRETFDQLTESWTETGIFRVLAEATVRPKAKGRLGKVGRSQRRSR